MHPSYDHPTLKNDVALLFTTINIQQSALVQIVPLSFNAVGGGVPVIAAGWGAVRVSGLDIFQTSHTIRIN